MDLLTDKSPTGVFSALHPDHCEEIIVGSSIDPDVADARGYRTLYGTDQDKAELATLGFSRSVVLREETYPALLIPMYRATGEVIAHQIKPKEPRILSGSDDKPRPVKYETPRGGVCHIDVPKFTQEHLEDVTKPFWFTEGIKKADALVSQGRYAIGMMGVYNWRRKLGTLGDWEDIPLKGRQAVICFDSDARHNRNVQQAMRRFGAWLVSKGVREVFYIIVPEEYQGTPVKGVDDWFSAGGDLSGLSSIKSTVPPGEGSKDASFTDAVLSGVVCEDLLDGSFCWSRGLGWMAWQKNVWREVADTVPTEAIRVWAIGQLQKVIEEQRKDSTKDMRGLMDGWRAILSKSRIKNILDLSRGILEKNPEDFDAEPDLLCVRNGYIDLRTGQLHDPDPDLLMTRSCPVEYKKDAKHPLWDKALEAVPEDTREWYRERIGQSATGYMTPDDILLICHGNGENGKSTIVNSIQNALGVGFSGYAVLLSDRVLMASPDAHPTELMDLRGARCAVLEETPEARRLDVHRLKKTVGTPLITARRIRQDDVTFRATHSLFVNTNFKPVVLETDHGTWRRLALLSFPYTYRKPGEKIRGPLDRVGDPALRSAAERDVSFRQAVLSWIVQGATSWYERNRVMSPAPPRVQEDTRNWRSETDLVLAFSSECLRFAQDATVSARDMVAAYNAWAEGLGHRPLSDKTFSSRFETHDVCRDRGVERRRVRPQGAGREAHPVMTWCGVTLSKGANGGESGSPWDDDDGGDNSDKDDNCDCVHGVRGNPVNEKSALSRKVSEPPCTPCTHQSALGSSNSPTCTFGQNGHDPGASPERQEETVLNDSFTPTTVTESEENRALPAAAPERSPAPSAPSVLPDVPAPSAEAPQGAFLSVPEPQGDVLGFDLEARGLGWLRWPVSGTVSYVSLSGWGAGDRIRVDRSPEALCARMRAGGRWVGHRALAYDVPVLTRHAGLPLAEVAGRVWDTELQARIADPPTSDQTKKGPRFKSYSLDAVAERVLGRSKSDAGKKLAGSYCTIPRCAHGKSKKCNGWENIDPSDPLYSEYCADDVSLAMQVYEALPKTPYMEREMRVQAILAQMTVNGFRVDVPLLERRIQEGEERKGRAIEELRTVFGLRTHRVKEMKNGSIRIEDFKSPLATTEGKEWLQGIYAKYGVKKPPLTEKGRLSTAAESLKAVGDNLRCPPELKHILELMSVVTSERTVYGTIRDHLVGDRVHSNIWPSQASGRWSVTEPGTTVMGKRGKLADERAVYLPEDGHSIICIDMGQVDARIVAAHAQDQRYLKLFLPGRDVHSETAIVMMGDVKYREDCKPITHTANYGGGADTLIAQGHDPNLVHKYFRERERLFPDLIGWQNRVREIGFSGGMLDNGFGRMLRVDPKSAYTQSPAQVGQGGTRDMMGEGLLDLVERAPEVLPYLRGIVHDEVVLSVPTEDAEEVGRLVVSCFERDWAPEWAEQAVHFTAGCTRPGKNWAHAYGK